MRQDEPSAGYFNSKENTVENLEQTILQETFSTTFTIEEDLGANYYRKLTQSFSDFCKTFMLTASKSKLEIIENDQLGGNYLQKYEQDGLTILFKLLNKFPPIAAQKSAQLDIVVSQTENTQLTNKFNIRLVTEENANNFHVNTCKIITLKEEELSKIEQKTKFWLALASL